VLQGLGRVASGAVLQAIGGATAGGGARRYNGLAALLPAVGRVATMPCRRCSQPLGMMLSRARRRYFIGCGASSPDGRCYERRGVVSSQGQCCKVATVALRQDLVALLRGRALRGEAGGGTQAAPEFNFSHTAVRGEEVVGKFSIAMRFFCCTERSTRDS
jgi:hypothetical protein